MASSSPAELSLELGVSQKRIREILRELYGTLPEGTTRWTLSKEQAGRVRDRIAGVDSELHLQWTLEPGDTVRRRMIHAAYGGQQQGGISTPRSIPDILIFTDPESGAKYGYDQFEGLREDGSYSYTGEGQVGRQEFLRGNRALRDATRDGKSIRLHRTKGVLATYVGAFTLGDPPYWIETIPDIHGDPREGIVFNLIPVDARVEFLPAFGGELPPDDGLINYVAHPRIWTPPEFSDVVIAAGSAPPGERVVSRVEFELQADFGAWITRNDMTPQRLPLRSGNVLIEPDMYVPEKEWIVEAKGSSGREQVRTAIGQVLDYVNVAAKWGLHATPIVLLPGKPQPDLVALLDSLEILVFIRDADGFVPISKSEGSGSA